MRLKPNTVSEFNKALEKEVLPLLQKQKGFRDELTLVSSSGSEVVGISLWEQRQDAEAYNRAAYPDVQRILSKVIEGTPQVQTYEVSLSTIHKVAAHTATRYHFGPSKGADELCPLNSTYTSLSRPEYEAEKQKGKGSVKR